MIVRIKAIPENDVFSNQQPYRRHNELVSLKWKLCISSFCLRYSLRQTSLRPLISRAVTMSKAPDNQMKSPRHSAGDVGVIQDRRVASATTRKMWEQRSQASAISTAAVIIVVGNFVTLVSLPWTQSALFGDTNPAIWLALGLLIPMGVLSLSIYRAYWKTRESELAKVERLGPYILKQKLGAGGMGEVYLGEHALMKRHCAIKLIHPERARDQDTQDCFAREAKATAQLTHWNTIEVYDYGTTEDGRFYYVMEYLEGVNLWQYVDKYGAMAPHRVIYVLKQLCDALYEAECAGLVHRDIKPSNIFLTERGQSFDIAKLLDFGLVQTVTDQPVGGKKANATLHGSPAFMCPEQAVGLAPDCRGDLYSLGAVAYFLLTGRPPFIDENPIMLIVAHATTSVPTFKEIGADVPEALGEIILRCLSREPSARYSSARELLEALEVCNLEECWTWRDAENWWAKNVPRSALARDTATHSMSETLPYTRPGDVGDSDKTVLNHELPTGDYDPLSEASINDAHAVSI